MRRTRRGGQITNAKIPYGQGDATEVNNVQLCVFDENLRTGVMIEILCSTVSETGGYLFGMPIDDPDDSTTADLRLVLVGQNRYVDIKNVTGDSYNKTIGGYDNVANTVITHDYAVISSNSGNFQNVLWILDSISDAARHFSSEYNIALGSVNLTSLYSSC